VSHPAWEAWDPFLPAEAAWLLRDLKAPWYVAAGWSIDLFLGGPRRDHEDLEIAIPAARIGEVAAALPAYELWVIDSGRSTPLAEANEELLARTHQTWVLDRATSRWRLDVFREPSDREMWICRRDEAIRLPYSRVIERTVDGIPFASPETTLLFKAKHTRPKDDEDLAAVLPRLDGARRTWLAEALELVHPGHRWISVLETT
jgi:Aminoglycoside-2''-adenylyltransferase